MLPGRWRGLSLYAAIKMGSETMGSRPAWDLSWGRVRAGGGGGAGSVTARGFQPSEGFRDHYTEPASLIVRLAQCALFERLVDIFTPAQGETKRRVEVSLTGTTSTLPQEGRMTGHARAEQKTVRY